MADTILWAPISWSHAGKHSGLVPLSRAIDCLSPGLIERVDSRSGQICTIFDRYKRLALRLIGRNQDWVAFRSCVPFYQEQSWLLERKIVKVVSRSSPSAVVLEGIEDQLFLLAAERRKWPRTKLVGISHQPPAWWQLNHARPELVEDLDILIVLASTAWTYWKQFIQSEKILIIPHGVDAEFFVPSRVSEKLSSTDGVLRVVFSGQWLRDFETLAGVISAADQMNLPVVFELIVPRHSRSGEVFYRMAMSPRVQWHSDLTDEALRIIYRRSDLMLLTLRDSTANNGLLEGMACGLPIIVTDVGGVRDYARETFANFVAPCDAAGIVEVLLGYLKNPDKLTDRGAAARTHVEHHLSWRKIASDYVAMLNKLKCSEGIPEPLKLHAIKKLKENP